MNLKKILTIPILGLLLLGANTALAENIDPDNDGSQYAYGQNVGWLNFEPNVAEPNVGATVSEEKLTGFIWAENIGWINLDPNDDDPNTGVSNDGSGHLSGLAWGENVGWINFNPEVSGDPNHYGVTIDFDGNFDGYAWGENIGWINFNPEVSGDPNHYGVTIDFDGNFDGYAWGENIGWINFNSADLFGYGVLACKVNYIDLDNFADDWLQSGIGIPADLDDSNDVDFLDYGVLAGYWLMYCPDDWPLK